MKGRFKFRWYSHIYQEMCEVNCIEPDNECINFNQGKHNNISTAIKSENGVLMQCTGLRDKNGKLIYEGDIVKSFHVSSTMQGRVLTGIVAYDNERCRYCILENKNGGYVTFSDTDDVFEVTGNIYENKELLDE